MDIRNIKKVNLNVNFASTTKDPIRPKTELSHLGLVWALKGNTALRVDLLDINSTNEWFDDNSHIVKNFLKENEFGDGRHINNILEEIKKSMNNLQLHFKEVKNENNQLNLVEDLQLEWGEDEATDDRITMMLKIHFAELHRNVRTTW